MLYHIYQITNKLNGKCYIGQSKNLEKRWKDHIYDSLRNPKYKTDRKCAIHNAILKYGPESFTWEIIDSIEINNIDEEKLKVDDLETSYILNKNSLSPNGYNLVTVGAVKIMSNETKEKIRNKLKTTSFLVGKTGKNHPRFGIPHSEEEKRSKSENYAGGNGPNVKLTKEDVIAIYQMYLDNEKMYPLEISKRFNISMSTVRNILIKKSWKNETAHLPDINLKDRIHGEKSKAARIMDADLEKIIEEYIEIKNKNGNMIEFYKRNKILASHICNIKSGKIRKNMYEKYFKNKP